MEKEILIIQMCTDKYKHMVHEALLGEIFYTNQAVPKKYVQYMQMNFAYQHVVQWYLHLRKHNFTIISPSMINLQKIKKD